MAQMVMYQKMLKFVPIVKYTQRFYIKGGFIIKSILMENQFESMRGSLATEKVELYVVFKGVYAPEIEQHIRTVKDRE